MRSKGRFIIIAAVALALIIGALPVAAFAAGEFSVSLSRSGPVAIMQGETDYVTIDMAPSASGSYMLVLDPADDDVVILSGNNSSFSGPGKASVTYAIRVTEGAKVGFHDMTLVAVDPSSKSKEYGRLEWQLEVLEKSGSRSNMDRVALDISYDVDGGNSFTGGQTQKLRLYFLNRGNFDLTNAKATITLPTESGLTLESGSVSANLAYINSGKTKTAEYPVIVSSKAITGSYPITIAVTGNSAGEAFTQTETFYIPVSGKDEEDDEKEALNLSISDITIPATSKENDTFPLSFRITNNGTKAAEKFNVLVDVPSGLVNTTDNNFYVASLDPGASKDFSVQMKVISAPVKGEYKNIRILTSSNDGISPATSVYAGTFATGTSDKKEEEKDYNKPTPILMVSGYNYGDEPVKAGTEFPLGITFLNTSNTTLRNIKVTVDAAAGAFIPVGSSSSFYIPSVGAGNTVTRELNMSCGASVVEGPTSVTVKMDYEDGEANKFSSSDTISVPVIQVTRLVIDEILDPGWLMVGEQAYVTVNYHNMGRNQINNLRVSVEGDFTVDGSPSSYIGNMVSGRSDYYNFNFFPLAEGPCNGTVTFTYENASGKEETIEKSFTFNINPGYQFEDEPMEPMEPEKQPLPLWGKIGIGVGAAAVLAAVLAALKKRKAKKQEALELDD